MALHLAGMSGSPARSKRTPEQQLVEFRVLDYLAERESVREERLRGATRVGKALLSGMVTFGFPKVNTIWVVVGSSLLGYFLQLL